eukprot:4444591-Prorocentrum_lima.AAC.1
MAQWALLPAGLSRWRRRLHSSAVPGVGAAHNVAWFSPSGVHTHTAIARQALYYAAIALAAEPGST